MENVILCNSSKDTGQIYIISTQLLTLRVNNEITRKHQTPSPERLPLNSLGPVTRFMTFSPKPLLTTRLCVINNNIINVPNNRTIISKELTTSSTIAGAVRRNKIYRIPRLGSETWVDDPLLIFSISIFSSYKRRIKSHTELYNVTAVEPYTFTTTQEPFSISQEVPPDAPSCWANVCASLV